jgi:hypothetical protein
MKRLGQPHIVIFVVATVLALGAAKFYHYNYFANTPGQARTLKLEGLRELVCQRSEYSAVDVDQCGKRSIYGTADWGVTAYFTIYGVESVEEAKSIFDFMRSARKRSGQCEFLCE